MRNIVTITYYILDVCNLQLYNVCFRKFAIPSHGRNFNKVSP